MAGTLRKIGGERSNRTLLLLALLFAVVAAVLVFVAVNQGGGDEEEGAEGAAGTAEVVVASRDISARTELTADMLKVEALPSDRALKGTFSDEEVVVGQVTRYPLSENEQVTLAKIGPQTIEEEEQGLSFVVPQGMRAFSIQVSEVSSVGGLVLPGDLVDIIAIFDEGEVEYDKAVTFLQRIEVLAVAQEAQEAIPPPTTDEAGEGEADEAEADATPEVASRTTLGARPEDVEANPGARTVTLAVTPAQAQLLALAQHRGELVLSLRGYGDEAEVPLDESTLSPWGGLPPPTPGP
jgi:pilus assembly protein CpaB